MFDLQPIETNCPQCGSECQAFKFGKVLRYECDPCADAEKAARRSKERRGECLAAWEDCTPELFREPVQPALLAEYLRPALDLSGTEGAGFIGATGSGKTRVAYVLLRKSALAGLRPFAVTGSNLRRAASEAHSDASGRSKAILSAARYAGALLLDDVGKGSTTEVGDEALFTLLDERRAHKRVTIWTSNGNGKWIAGRYKADRGPAIAVRLANLAGCYAPGTGRIYTDNQKP